MVVVFKSGAPGGHDACIEALLERPFMNLQSAEDAAFRYNISGFCPVPLVGGTKKPAVAWKAFSYAPGSAGLDFGHGKGIALRLGTAHGGLVDVDLDTPWARTLASKYLPSTMCVFGRPSAPCSHYMYRCEEGVQSIKYQAKIGGKLHVFMELRGGEQLVTVPPSKHPSGELVRFEEKKDGHPAIVPPGFLRECADKLAASALMACPWGDLKGARQELALAIAGGLLSTGAAELFVQSIIEGIATAAKDAEVQKRVAAVHDTATKLAAGKHVTGWTRVRELLGVDGPEIVSKFRAWLGDNTPDSEGPGLSLSVKVAESIAPKKIDWLWHGMIPRAELTLIDGDPGTGKSTICLDLVARLSAGKPMPDASATAPADAIVISNEDSAHTTIVPRLLAAGANLSRVNLVSMVKVAGGAERSFSIPEDLPLLRQRVLARSAKLIVIEPLVAFLNSKADANNDQQVRRALGPLKALAEETGAAIIVVRHLNKKQGLSAIYRGGGSIGITGAVRSALMVGVAPDDPATRVLVSVKSNLGQSPDAWRYRIIGHKSPPENAEEWEAGAVEWLGTSKISASQLVGEQVEDGYSAMKEAKDFLEEVLGAGPMLAGDLFKLAVTHGHSKKTIDRASKQLGVDKVQLHDGKKITGWQWSLGKEAKPKALEGKVQPGDL